MNGKMGWILAGVFVVLIGALIVFFVFFPQPSSPTNDTEAPGAMDLNEPAQPITLVVPVEPKGEGNAADDYKKAVDIVKPIFEKAIEDGKEPDQTILNQVNADVATWMPSEGGKPMNKLVSAESLKLLRQIAQYVADGATKAQMRYPFEKFEITYLVPETKYFDLISQALCDLAFYEIYVDKKPEEAQKLLHDRMILGWHMSRDRVYPYFVWTGLGIQWGTCYQLNHDLYSTWTGHENQMRQVEQYAAAVKDTKSFFDKKKKFMFDKFTRSDDKPNPGDIFNVVENDKDPCWRIQGIFDLGMLKHSPALETRGDRRYLHVLLADKLKNGTDDEKAAAKAADEFTLDDYKGLGAKNSQY